MRIVCLSDKNNGTDLSRDLLEKLFQAAVEAGHEMDVIDLAKDDLAFCFGCMRCWSSGTGKCVSGDRLPEIDKKIDGCGLIIFLSPVIFGTFSSIMKTPIEKGVGNKLTDSILYPQLVIGYGEDMTEEEERCFIDLTVNHRGAADIVHPELSGVHVDAWVTRTFHDNDDLVRKFTSAYI